ncbi:MAG: helix-hairpin-helix domain-containing protein, partial [Gemmatimonadota bacterium]|nr:helix-hairpin-helix domain-containing protein [Gemmatimonadota bacterium]
VDTASAASLRQLPHVGASLALRIVANRDSLGPFGSLAGLARVRGVGCTMLQSLAPHVTFSASTRLPRGDGGSGGDVDDAPCDHRRLRLTRPP